MNNEQSENYLSISEASERTGLPESTIRYYDNEFEDYLQIKRGSNNERLFDEENLKELEYIRYLIKRENLSIDQVKQRLEEESEFRDRVEDQPTIQKPPLVEDPATKNKVNFEPAIEKLTDQLDLLKNDLLEQLENNRDQELDTDRLLNTVENHTQKMDTFEQQLMQIRDQLEHVQESQQSILHLLDMNLERYNKIVENLP